MADVFKEVKLPLGQTQDDHYTYTIAKHNISVAVKIPICSWVVLPQTKLNRLG